MSWKRKFVRNWGRLGMRFKTEKLGDFLYVKGRIGWKGLKKDEYLSDGVYRIINGEALTKDGIDWSKAGFISKERYEESPEIMLQNDDILISKDGTIGKLGFVRNLENPSTVASGIFVLRNLKPEMINIRFIYNYLSSVYFRNFIISRTEGSVIPHLYQKDFVDLYFPLPSLKEQNKIVDVLDTISCKIEINKMINNNLEQQMRALFNEFLLVNHFNSLTTVEDAVLTANTGADAIQKAPIVDYDTGVRCIRVGDMTNNRSFHAWGFTKVTDDVFKRYQLHKDDIVVTRTASIGLNTIIAENLSAVYNNGLIRLTVNHSKILPLFLYRQFQTVDFTNYIARIESETSVRPNMKINYLLKYEFVLPPMDKQKELIDLLAPMLNQQNALITESKHLENLRDTLLPKLMSGEIDVSDIEI